MDIQLRTLREKSYTSFVLILRFLYLFYTIVLHEYIKMNQANLKNGFQYFVNIT